MSGDNGMQMETFSVHSGLPVWAFLVLGLFVTGNSVTLWKDIQRDKRSRVFAPNNTVAQQTPKLTHSSLKQRSINAQLGPGRQKVLHLDVDNGFFCFLRGVVLESGKESVNSYKGLNFRDGCLTFGVLLWHDLCSSSPNTPRVTVTISLQNSHLPHSCHGKEKRQ